MSISAKTTHLAGVGYKLKVYSSFRRCLKTTVGINLIGVEWNAKLDLNLTVQKQPLTVYV